MVLQNGTLRFFTAPSFLRENRTEMFFRSEKRQDAEDSLKYHHTLFDLLIFFTRDEKKAAYG